MAYSSSSSSSSFPHNLKAWDRGTITQEEFFAFHNIDRQLFIRLVFNMRCEPMEAMNVAAFWMWLERLNMAQYVVNIITYSDRIFKSIFEETLLCLKVVESDTLVHSYEIPMLQIIVGKDKEGVDLKFIHNNRVSILLGIDHFVKQICVRAFQDLIQIALASRPYIPQSSMLGVRGTLSVGVVGDGRIGGFRPTPRLLMSSSNYGGKLWGDIGDLVNYHNLITRVGEMNDVPLKNEQYRSKVLNHKSSLGVGASSSNYGSMFSINRVINKSNYGLGSQSQILQGDLVEPLLDQLTVNNANSLIEEKPNVLPNERTIFLTFSKGYPILEYELREFISSSFGDIIETLQMQEVGANEQPLYARLVVRDARAMKIVLSEHGRTKFSINGKHVWARKYVCKNSHSPLTANTPTY